MRFIYGSEANYLKTYKGEPVVEVVLHSFEGEDRQKQKLNLAEWRFFTGPEQLREIAERLNKIADGPEDKK